MIRAILLVTALSGVADEQYETWDSKPVKINPKPDSIKSSGTRNWARMRLTQRAVRNGRILTPPPATS